MQYFYQSGALVSQDLVNFVLSENKLSLDSVVSMIPYGKGIGMETS
jgi:hypothetical protein